MARLGGFELLLQVMRTHQADAGFMKYASLVLGNLAGNLAGKERGGA